MKLWNYITIACLLLAFSLTIKWGLDGFHVFTKDKSEIITIVKDEIFGENIEKREWVDNFQLGLLPDDPSPLFAYRSLSIPAALLLLTAYFSYRKSRSTTL